MKLCRICGETKPYLAFSMRRETGRHRSECKVCRNKVRKAWNEANPEPPEVHRKRSRDHYSRNRQSEIVRSSAWNKDNAEKRVDTHLRRTFNITLDLYNFIFREQENVCVICKNPETAVDKRSGKVRRLHVDHDHKTGMIRGLLCTRCNLAVGFLQNDADRADSVARYLRLSESVDPVEGLPDW